MNNNTKIILVAVVGLVISNLVLLGFIIKGKSHRHKHGHHGPREAVIRQLNFDDHQVKKYDEYIEKHQSEIRPLHDSLMSMKKTLYGLLKNNPTGNPDSIVQQMIFFQQQIEIAHYHHFSDVKALCTSDQLKNFDQLTDEMANFFSPHQQKQHHKKHQ
jgi:protein CpxP